MGKVVEGHSMNLMSKWGITTPRYVVANSLEEFDTMREKHPWLDETRLVVKAHEAIGGRGLLGLVKKCTDLKSTRKAIEDILSYDRDSITINQVIVEENVTHSRKREFYASVISRREGVELLLSPQGGVNVEKNWNSVLRLKIPTGTAIDSRALEDFAGQAGFDPRFRSLLAEFLQRVLTMFDGEDATYLEINPFTVLRGCKKVVALDAVLDPKKSRYLYFVSKNDGTHYFSRTEAEHEKAVDKYQRGK